MSKCRIVDRPQQAVLSPTALPCKHVKVNPDYSLLNWCALLSSENRHRGEGQWTLGDLFAMKFIIRTVQVNLCVCVQAGQKQINNCIAYTYARICTSQQKTRLPQKHSLTLLHLYIEGIILTQAR